MIRLRFAVPLALILAAQPALAQRAPRPSVTAGPVAGLELSIEGSQHAPRGGRLRFLLAVHEVLGLADLRPAARAHVRVFTSLDRNRAAVEAACDALGRAEVAIDVPEDAPESFALAFEAVSAGDVRRQFDLDVHADPPTRIVLEVDRTRVRAGQFVRAWGRVENVLSHRTVDRADVFVTLLDARGRPVHPAVTVRTDRAGGFQTAVRLPDEAPATFRLDASTTDGSDAGPIALTTDRAAGSSMQLRAVATHPVVAPGDAVVVAVQVSTEDGRPVRGARVTSSARDDSRAALQTDAHGRAQFTVTAAAGNGADVRLQDVTVRATRVGVGSAEAHARWRVTRHALFAAVSAEGGALVPSLPGRVYVRVVGADGAPAGPGVRVALTGGRFGRGATARTDADGAAVLDTGLSARSTARADADDPCGGETAAGFALSLERGHEQGETHGCLAVDPDATVRVRTPQGPRVHAGARWQVELTRASAVAAVPIEVALLAATSEGLAPVASRLVAPGVRTVEVALPPDVTGVVTVRARPWIGATGRVVRGGVTSVQVVPAEVLNVDARVGSDGAPVALTASGGGAASAREAAVIVLPQDEAARLLARLRSHESLDGLEGGDASCAGALAARVAVDDAAPDVLRNGVPVSMPAPAEPVSRGTLRDPWRARARFVEGRLALVFARIEQHVDEAIADRRDDVARRGPDGRWAFNREMLDAIADDTQGGGLHGLGGGALDIATLERLDPAFTYDHVARRLTRRRMFTVLTALRRFVHAHALDLGWSWRGDPTSWLDALEADESTGDAVPRVDGWGTRFALRPAPGGHARFAFLSPVPGYELVSAGPDTRFGTADDQVDPFARVLPAGGAYGRAVDEDALLARLHGVERSHATLERLATAFEVDPSASSIEPPPDEPGMTTTASWDDVPSPIEPEIDALDPVQPSLRVASRVALAALNDGPWRLDTTVDDDRRTFTAVIDAWSTEGAATVTSVDFDAGSPVSLRVPLVAEDTVPRLRIGEPVVVRAYVVDRSSATRAFGIVVHGSDVLEASAPATVRLVDDVGSFALALRPMHAGRATLDVTLVDERGQPVRSVHPVVDVDDGSLALHDDAGMLVRGGQSGQRVLRARTGLTGARLIVESASAIADDPELDTVRAHDPALIAWAYAVASRPLPPALALALYDAHDRGRADLVDGASPVLSTACALVAWSTVAGSDERAAQSMARATRGLASRTSRSPDALRESAAVLAAIATGSQGADDDPEAAPDPVTQLSGQLRASLRAASHTEDAHPTRLARAAAALLLVDPADARAAAMYLRARASVERRAGEAWLRGEDADERDALAGTAALAIAARQRGDEAMVRALSTALARRAHVALRLGGETGFWMLAAAAYGAFGSESPGELDVRVDGRRLPVTLHDGRATVALASALPAREMRVTVSLHGASDAAVHARLEATHARSYAAPSDGPLSIAIAGDPGHADEIAAMECVLRNTTTIPVHGAVVEIALPAGSTLDAPGRDALRAASHVARVTTRDGIVRVVLDRLEGGQSIALPLAVRWRVEGRVTGFAAAAYVEARPDRFTTLAPRSYDIHPRASDD